MTQDNANNKLTLSGKSTLTLKNIGDTSRSHSHDGKKFVQVEVRKKRIINPAAAAEPKVEIDEATAQKLKLIAEAKEHEARRRQEEEEREKERARQRELEEKERLKREQEEAERKAAEASAPVKPERKEEPAAEDKFKVKKSKDYDDDEEDDEDDYHSKKFKKPVIAEKSLSREEAFEQERKKIMKRSFEPQRRGGKVNLHSIGSVDDDDDDYGFGGPRRRFKKKQPKPVQPQQPQEKIIKDVVVPEIITVQELANRMAEKGADVIKKLMALGVMATINQPIDGDTAQIVVEEMGHRVKRVSDSDVELGLKGEEDRPEEMQPRAPVVTVMGHVDHGKTSILDRIRNAHVAAGEAGGITQHIGAYQVNIDGQDITFLDTPGHEAFTSMRARGANITDIAILVVAADDGIMPQTIESINHAKAAGVSIIVAINKMDKEGANPDRIKEELTKFDLVCEDWGGDIICVPVSAKTGEGIDELLENVLLVAEVKELKANPERLAKGTVIEARLDKGRGPIATLLVQNGTLKQGDVLIAGTSVGRVRVMTSDKGRTVKSAGPSVPVEITGLADVPSAGDIFNAVEDERLARELVEKRRHEAKQEQFNAYRKVTLDNLFSQIAEGEIKELPIIVKADVQGSVEAVKQSLEKLSNNEVRVRVIHGAVGAVKESDVMLASASNAIIVGFNVRPDPVAAENAARDGVDIRLYRIIYDAIEEISTAMKGMLAPKFRDVELGRVEVRQVYKISNVGMVAGSYVLSGKATRGCQVRVVRDGIIIADDKIAGLKRFKDDVKEVADGYECGISLEKFSDVKEGDIFETYVVEEYRED